MVRAVIYIPPDVAGDGAYAFESQRYVQRRGYLSSLPGAAVADADESIPLAPILRSWDVIDRLLLIGWAQVVVVARREHAGDRRHVEVAEEDNAAAAVDSRSSGDATPPAGRVTILRGPGRGGGRHRASSASLTGRVLHVPSMSERQAARIIDGEEPIPEGIDPATVAAVRRIARKLGGLRPRQ